MKKELLQTLKNLAAAENAFVDIEFLAPVLRGSGVAVKIAGVRCNVAIDPPDFQGWGVFRADSLTSAALLREATPTQRRNYLRLLPSVRLIVCGGKASTAMALPANPSDTRFYFAGPVFVQLCPKIDLFTTIMCRFYAAQFWFDSLDSRTDPAAAAYLRRELTNMTEPKNLSRRGVTRGERFAYAFEFSRRASAILADRRHRADVRLKQALAHAGAILTDFSEDHDLFRVAYLVDGRRHLSNVRKDDLTVQSAGICLAGQDRNFDLASLVGVLREGDSMSRFPRRR